MIYGIYIIVYIYMYIYIIIYTYIYIYICIWKNLHMFHVGLNSPIHGVRNYLGLQYTKSIPDVPFTYMKGEKLPQEPGEM